MMKKVKPSKASLKFLDMLDIQCKKRGIVMLTYYQFGPESKKAFKKAMKEFMEWLDDAPFE